MFDSRTYINVYPVLIFNPVCVAHMVENGLCRRFPIWTSGPEGILTREEAKCRLLGGELGRMVDLPFMEDFTTVSSWRWWPLQLPYNKLKFEKCFKPIVVDFGIQSVISWNKLNIVVSHLLLLVFISFQTNLCK